MTKTARRTLIVMVTAVLVIAAMYMSSSFSFAEEGYKYTVTVYSGRQGTFNGKTEWKKEFKPGEMVRIDLDTLGFEPKKDSKYYVRGFRIAGHDNDETTGFQTMEFEAGSDVSYEIAYGIKGELVKYTARYLEKDSGKEIQSQDTFYGMPGDKPVVSFRHVKGYEPHTYNITKTLSEDESKNVLTFYYTKKGSNEQTEAPQAPGTSENPAGTKIGDSDSPKADGGMQMTDLDGDKTPGALPEGIELIGAGAAVILATMILIILILLKRRKRDNRE